MAQHAQLPEAVSANLEAPNPKDEPHASREDDLRQPIESHLPHIAIAHKPTTESPLHRHGYQPNSSEHRRAGRTSGESDNSMERSPLHPHYHVKAATRGGVSSKGSSVSSHALASNVAGRSRPRTGGRGDETPDKGSSVPKFGEWDESNPSSADGFTGIFNKVREEKRVDQQKLP